jgi:hypothetical protein
MELEHTIGFADLGAEWLRLIKGGTIAGQPAVETARVSWRDTGFTGMTVGAMEDAITNGYVAEGMKVKPTADVRPRRRSRFSEEDGELQVDLALSGSDAPFIARPKVRRAGGMTLKIELAVRATTPASVMRDYSAWLVRLIAGLQAKGIDLQIDVVSRAKVVTTKGEPVCVNVRVKRFGRRSDLKSWGAMFAPGGFRMLMFCGRLMACAAHGRQLEGHFGASVGPKWDIEHDRATQTLTVKCAAQTTRFPTEMMDARLAELGVI